MIRNVLRLYRDAFAGLGRDVWLICVVLLVNRAGTMVLPFITLYLTEQRDLTVAMAGRMLSLYGLGAVAGAYIGGWLCDRVPCSDWPVANPDALLPEEVRESYRRAGRRHPQSPRHRNPERW